MSVDFNDIHSIEYYDEIKRIIGKVCGITVSQDDPIILILLALRQANAEAFERFIAAIAKFEYGIDGIVAKMDSDNNIRAEKMISASLTVIKKEALEEKRKNIEDAKQLLNDTMTDYFKKYMAPNLIKLNAIKKLTYIAFGGSIFAFCAAVFVVISK